ncbi:MAG: response regulator [Anaerolineae bacterium]|nr:response regulator [Anaerolineae bacterium]
MDQGTKMRIVVGDRDARVRSALRILLREESSVILVGESSDLPSLVAQVKELQPDLILLDWELSGRPAAALLLARAKLKYQPKVIVFSARSESEEEILAAGADAFVSKTDPPEALLSAFREVTLKSGDEVVDLEKQSSA